MPIDFRIVSVILATTTCVVVTQYNKLQRKNMMLQRQNARVEGLLDYYAFKLDVNKIPFVPFDKIVLDFYTP